MQEWKWVRKAYMLEQMQESIKSVNIVPKVPTAEVQSERLVFLLFNKSLNKLPQVLSLSKH